MNQLQIRLTLLGVALALTSACAVRDVTAKPDPEPSEEKSWLWNQVCTEEAEETPEPEVVEEPIRCDDNLNATLWVQSSAEYQMAARQAWFLAEQQLNKALKDRKWTAAVEQTEGFNKLKPAVIVDVDETVLDNSPYQARLVRDKASFHPDTWALWCEEKRAEPVPGALEFAQYAASKGVRVFYVTNRTHDIETCTRENLVNLGFPMDPEVDTLLTKRERPEWTSDKGTRRTFIATEHRILLMAGDQLGDFVDGSKGSLSARNATMEQYQEWLGSKWIFLPNPTYGHWLGALHGHDRSLDVRTVIDKKYNALRP